MGGARAEYKLNIAGSVARRRREIFEIIRLENAVSFAKIMLLERFRNVAQAILNTKIIKIPGRRPDFFVNVFSIANPPLVRLLSETDFLTKIHKGTTLRIFGRRPNFFQNP